MNLNTVLNVSLGLAREAGARILDHYGDSSAAKIKADGSPLTLADEAANQIITEGLIRSFPGAAILSEESPDNLERLGNDWCFLVDPLDGTKEFLSRNGEFTVNIALIHRGAPLVGVVFAPALGVIYYAHRAGGAWCQSAEGAPRRLYCGTPQVPPRLAVSRSHRSPEEDRFILDNGIQTVVPMGSSLKGCLVASGEADLYLRAGTVMEWDIAAMHAVVEEAGGRLLPWNTPSNQLLYNQKSDARVFGFRCGNPLSVSLR